MKIRGQQVYEPVERIERMSIPEPNSGCWIWLGSARGNQCGILYGRMIAGSRSDGTRRSWSAHRYSFEAFNGAIPDGHVVCHRCDNGLCVNPGHLFSGTQSENVSDAVRKGRVIPPRRYPKPPEATTATKPFTFADPNAQREHERIRAESRRERE